MGFLDKAKVAASKVADGAVKAAGDAKAKYDEHQATKEADAYAKENEGLTSEEIVAKDEAKKVIYFPKVEYGKSVDTKRALTDSITDQMAYGHDFSSANVVANTHTGLTVHLLNASERRIKYIDFTFSAVNRVGDVFQTKSFKQMGPIEPGKKATSFAQNLFDSSPDNLILDKVVIEYFEGDKVVFEDRWVNRLVKNVNANSPS